MKNLVMLIVLVLALASAVNADYYWSYRGEELADLLLDLYFNGDSLTRIKDCDSGITSFDTTLNLDSIGRGFFQIRAQYLYSNSNGIYVEATEPYNNLDGESDGISFARIYAYDTANTAVIAGTKLSMYTYPGGIYKYTKTTLGAGYADFWVTQSGQYRIYAADPPGFGFASSKIITVDTGSGSMSIDSIFGYGMSAPAASPSVSYVTAYIDVGTGIVDTSGNMGAQTDGIMYVNLVGEGLLRIDSTWAIVAKEYKATSSTTGRYTFHLPANVLYSPVGSYYELSYQAGRSSTGGRGAKTHWFNFVLDTIPDPVNLLDTANVQRVP